MYTKVITPISYQWKSLDISTVSMKKLKYRIPKHHFTSMMES